MKILVYAINYFPELISTGKYTTEMCEWLVQHNHEVRVITAQPYYPDWKVFAGYQAWCYKTENIKKVKVMRCPIWVPHKPTGLKRFFHLLSFAVSSFVRLLTQASWQPDAIFFIEPTFFCFPGALLFSKLTKAAALLHIQDFEIDTAFALGILKSKYLRKILLKFENYVIKHCQFVSTISPNMHNKLLAKGMPATKTILFPNWVELDLIKPLTRPSSIRKKLHLKDDDIVCLYSGNLGEKQGLEIIIESAYQLQNKSNLVFVLSGAGPYKDKLQQLIAERKIINIKWLPLQPLCELNELLNLADIHLLPQREEVADLVMPSKLLGMLASGRPIVATALPDTQVYNVVKNAGRVAIPGKINDFTKKIAELAEDLQVRQEIGAKARKYALENLNKDKILADYEKYLKLC